MPLARRALLFISLVAFVFIVYTSQRQPTVLIPVYHAADFSASFGRQTFDFSAKHGSDLSSHLTSVHVEEGDRTPKWGGPVPGMLVKADAPIVNPASPLAKKPSPPQPTSGIADYMKLMMKWNRPDHVDNHWPPYENYQTRTYDPNRWEAFESLVPQQDPWASPFRKQYVLTARPVMKLSLQSLQIRSWSVMG